MTTTLPFKVHGHELKMEQRGASAFVMSDTVPGLFLTSRTMSSAGKAVMLLEWLSCMQNGLRPYLSPAHRNALMQQYQ